MTDFILHAFTRIDGDYVWEPVHFGTYRDCIQQSYTWLDQDDTQEIYISDTWIHNSQIPA